MSVVRREVSSVERVLRWVAVWWLVERAVWRVEMVVGRRGWVVLGARVSADWRGGEWRRVSRSGLLDSLVSGSSVEKVGGADDGLLTSCLGGFLGASILLLLAWVEVLV